MRLHVKTKTRIVFIQFNVSHEHVKELRHFSRVNCLLCSPLGCITHNVLLHAEQFVFEFCSSEQNFCHSSFLSITPQGNTFSCHISRRSWNSRLFGACLKSPVRLAKNLSCLGILCNVLRKHPCKPEKVKMNKVTMVLNTFLQQLNSISQVCLKEKIMNQLQDLII